MRGEFIRELVVELVQAKPIDASDNLIILLVEDILWYIKNEEDKEYEMNQNLIRMKELFRG